MLVNNSSLANIFGGFKTAFNKGFAGAPTVYPKIAMEVPSTAREETYAWLGQFPKMREWVGDRVVNQLIAYGYAVKNRRFESTIEVPREDIEDDSYGVFAPLFQEMGAHAAQHPDELVCDLLGSGFTATGYDGKAFFAADHPSFDASGEATTASNIQTGAGSAWFLIDGSRPFRPLIWQARTKYELQSFDRPDDYNVFMADKHLYGVRARGNAGLGLWQLAFGSKADLTIANYEAARAAMAALRGDGGRKLGAMATTLVVPSELEGDGRRIVNAQLVNDGSVAVSNVWAGSAELIVAQRL
ncbi:MAG: hypothetical protein GC191_20630 [Azospirillum sp.]|nr:hypothetical protein [Azospirillum sp.]